MKINDYVTRISHNNDILFKIISIKDNIAILSGEDVRLIADAYLDDLILSDIKDDFYPELNNDLDRSDYFYLPGRVLHIDGDETYLNRSMDFYKKNGVFAIGKKIKEKDIPNKLYFLLTEIKPDILVITGHDSIVNKCSDFNNINCYKNSKYFIDAVKIAREYEPSHEKLIIIAGACQSFYEELIKSGANFASSPKRCNIHALDPSIIASSIAFTSKYKMIDLKNILAKTKYGSSGMGGLVGTGVMYTGYPR